MDWWPPWLLFVTLSLVRALDVSDICTRCSCHYLDSAHIAETVCSAHQTVLDVNCTARSKVSENANIFSVPPLAPNATLTLWVSFDNSDLTSIQRNLFFPFSDFNVTRLSLDDNEILIVPAKVFSKLTNLTVLSLTNNRIITFSSDSIKGLNMLRVLDLSYNRLKDIDLNIALDSSSLQHLDLSQNLIETMTVPVTGVSSLQTLDLSDNKIQELPLKAFGSFPHLISLNISHNNISYVSPDLFQEQTALQVLDLSGNRLKAIDSASVQALGSLLRLFVGHNLLSEVSFASVLSNLKTLDVGQNNISSLGNSTVSLGLERFVVSHNSLQDLNEVFLTFPNLKSLDASWNPCPKFPDHVRAGLQELILDGTLMTSWAAQFPGEGSLTYLSMSHIDGLKGLGPNAFSGIIKSKNKSNSTNACAVLKISHTALEDIDEDAFKQLDLCKLDLSYNQLRWIPEDLVEWNSMVGVDLQGNPWNCDCSLQWMVNTVIPAAYKTDQGLLEELKCATPEHLQGKRLVHWYNRGELSLCGKNRMLMTKAVPEPGITEKIIMSSSPIMIAAIVFLGCVAIMMVLLAFALQRRALRKRRERKNRRF